MTYVAEVVGPSPSGFKPICCGVREIKRSARSQTVNSMTKLITAAACENPSNPIEPTQSGEKITPPILPPLYAMARAAGRERTNQGETIALTAAALIAPQPAPLNTPATKRCQGASALAHPRIPTARQIAPAFVAVAAPKRRYSAGKFALVTAPMRKWPVTLAEMNANGQPLVSRSTLRNTGGP